MTKKIGVSHTAPKSDARPLGTKAPRTSAKRKTTATTDENNSSATEENACNVIDFPVESSQSVSIDESSAAIPLGSSQQNPTTQELPTMNDITLSRNTKDRKSTALVYSGNGISIRVAKTAFAEVPDTLVLQSPTAYKGVKAPETKEERKARLAAAPKLTLAEKIAKREKQLDAMRAKAAAEASQPSL